MRREEAECGLTFAGLVRPRLCEGGVQGGVVRGVVRRSETIRLSSG